MSRAFYILSDRQPVASDVASWGEWFEHSDLMRTVGDICIGQTRVATYFVGFDLRPQIYGSPPLLFETQINRPGRSEVVDKYATWDEAERGHQAVEDRIMQEALD
jgi:hypothetical protein